MPRVSILKKTSQNSKYSTLEGVEIGRLSPLLSKQENTSEYCNTKRVQFAEETAYPKKKSQL